MKKIILTIFCLAPLGLIAQQAFTLKGNAKALKTGDKIYLSYQENGQRKTDSAMVTNGDFEFKGMVASTVSGNLFKNINPFVKGAKTRFLDYVAVYVEPGNIEFKSIDSVKSAKITGTPTNNDNIKFTAQLKPFADKMKAIDEEYAKYTPAQKEDKALMGALRERAGKISDEMNPVALNFAKNNPNS